MPSEAAATTLVHSLEVVTDRPTTFVDLTGRLEAIVAGTGVRDGILHVQTQHTTTGLLINEAEPLLLEDLTRCFEAWAPRQRVYAHDDFRTRTVNMTPGERRNGWAHCRAALLRTSESIVIGDGRLRLGRWQRVLFAEFDGPRRRELAVLVQPVA
ncbi:MAG: secondary thiamine-phosphate synthase enzyme YjbQ [Vicinamibacterales bacterium]